MLTVSGINFAQKANQASISNKQSQQYSIKTHSQPMRDTVSFTSFKPLSELIGNFGEVIEGKLFRGMFPGQHLGEFKAQKGVKYIIDLSDEHHTRTAELFADDFKKLSIEYIPIKLIDGYLPEALPQRREIAEQIGTLMKKGPVYVCCGAGQMRTGIVIASVQHFIERLSRESILEHAKLHQSTRYVETLLDQIAEANI